MGLVVLRGCFVCGLGLYLVGWFGVMICLGWFMGWIGVLLVEFCVCGECGCVLWF